MKANKTKNNITQNYAIKLKWADNSRIRKTKKICKGNVERRRRRRTRRRRRISGWSQPLFKGWANIKILNYFIYIYIYNFPGQGGPVNTLA